MTTAPGKALNILITGGARGIGRGLFRQFLAKGHQVIVLDSNAEELEQVKTQAGNWKNAQGNWHALQCDLSKREQIKDAVRTVKETFDGKLDDQWDLKIAIGLTATFILSRLCVPLLINGSSTPGSPGTIFNLSSTRAYQAEADHEAYSTAKAGILGLTQSMSISLGHRHKICVNAIIPGWIHVENESKAADEKGTTWEEGLSKEDIDWHPAGRVGKSEDIVRAAEFLIESGFVTGQEVVVDGGVGRKMVYPE
ncbi:short-chain dehydrogenase/reductase-like protein SDR [Lizonia empirigonia]|nr:short-chain dehydrogenase/reductase-like protein SDR [Lizonia empirigonia]